MESTSIFIPSTNLHYELLHYESHSARNAVDHSIATRDSTPSGAAISSSSRNPTQRSGYGYASLQEFSMYNYQNYQR